jgi:quercetin dioxygenase-like cupin family protein
MKLARIALLGAALMLSCRTPSAQRVTAIDPVAVSPDRFKVLLENEHIRVVEYSLQPGERDKPHTHPPKVSYVVNGGSVRIHLDDGTSFPSDEKQGTATWMNALPRHFAENVGGTPVRIVLFEIRRSDAEPAPPAEDPVQVNPSSIRTLLENDSVRVMEAVLPPGYRETMHTHPPYAMYIVEGGAVRLHMADGRSRDSEFKAGAVFFSDRITHLAENRGSSTIKAILVEMRRR